MNNKGPQIINNAKEQSRFGVLCGFLQNVAFVILFCSVQPAFAINSHTNNYKTLADTLTFGVVPQQSAKKIAATWGPIIRQLSTNTGLKITFATAPSIPEFERRLAAQQYDIAYMNPYHYVVFSEQSGYWVIAKQLNKSVRGIVVVKKDSVYTSLKELNANRLAFPAPLSFAATLIPQAAFRAENIAISPTFVQSHDSVYMGVAKGFFTAGGGVLRTLNSAPKDIQDQLRVLWQSPGYTPHAIALSANVNKEIGAKLTDGLIALTQKDLLAGINFRGFEAATDAQWDSIRDLKINVSAQSSQ